MWHDRMKKSLEKAKDPDIARLLVLNMRDISENYFAAGWLGGLEHILWAMVLGGSREFGFAEVSEEEVINLKHLSEKAGGWWCWFDSPEPDESGELFVTSKEWQNIYEKGVKVWVTKI